MTIADNVIELDVVTSLDIPASRVLSRASEAALESAVVIGWDAEGDFYFSSSVSDGGSVLWLIELAKKKLLDIGCGERGAGEA